MNNLVSIAILMASLLTIDAFAADPIPSPNPPPSAADLFHQHRAHYREQRAAILADQTKLLDQYKKINDEIATTQAAIQQAMRAPRPAAPPRTHAAPAEDPLANLRLAARVVEGAVFSSLYPAFSFLEKIAHLGAILDGGRAGQSASQFSRTLQVIMSVMLVVTFVLAALFLRKYHTDYFAKHRRWIIRLGLVFLVVIPISAFAEEAADPSLEALLSEANDLLGKTPVQQYLLDLSAASERIGVYQIKNVMLKSAHLRAFYSFTLGTAEHYTTLATLYEMNGQPQQAIEPLRAFATRSLAFTDRKNAESVVASVIQFLLSQQQIELASAVLESQLAHLSSARTLSGLYRQFSERSLSVSANLLAERLVETHGDTKSLIALVQQFNASGDMPSGQKALQKATRLARESNDLLQLAQVFYQRRDITSGQNALRKALPVSASVADVSAILKQAIEHNETDIIIEAIDHIQRTFSDISEFLGFADQLRTAARPEESDKVIVALIEKANSGSRMRIHTTPTDTVGALKYISQKTFELGLYGMAEKSAQYLIRRLSSDERKTFAMALPQDQVDTLGIPEPEQVVAPLYFGVLLQAMDAISKADHLYERETKALLADLIDTSGLTVPDMLNHLFLLGSRLADKGEFTQLAELDKLMQKLETNDLEQLRADRKPALESTRKRVDGKQKELQNLRRQLLEIKARQQVSAPTSVAASNQEPGYFSLAFSAVFLPLRILALTLFSIVIAIGLIRIAWHYSQQFSEQRFYGFAVKLAENTGWVFVFTILSAPVGLIMVFAAQFAQLPFAFDGSRKRDELMAKSRQPEREPAPQV